MAYALSPAAACETTMVKPRYSGTAGYGDSTVEMVLDVARTLYEP